MAPKYAIAQYAKSAIKNVYNHASTYVFFSKLLQIIVISVTLACASLGIWGTLLIRQHFNPVLLLPADSYLRQWIATSEDHFPQVSVIIHSKSIFAFIYGRKFFVSMDSN